MLSQNVRDNDYSAIRKLVETSDKGNILTSLLRKAGILDIVNGRRRWAQNMSMLQASYLGGLSAESVFDAMRSYAFYDENPNAFDQNQRMLRRNNSIVLQNLALQDI